MKISQLNQFTEKYLAALKTHWDIGSEMEIEAANNLGNEAVALRLETLQLAAIHEQALKALYLSSWTPTKRETMTNRAALFFNEVIAPVEKTHPAAVQSRMGLEKASSDLKSRTRQLAASSSALKSGIASRKGAKRRLQVSQNRSDKLLKESAELEQQLHDVAQRILETTEAQRKKISLALQEEIAQTLIGIHVRLLALKKSVQDSGTRIGSGIVGTQRLAALSHETIKRFTVEFGRPHEI